MTLNCPDSSHVHTPPGVEVGVGVDVLVGNGVLVAVGISVGVLVGNGVFVAVGMSVGVLVGNAVGVSDGNGVFVAVGVLVGVLVGNGVFDGVGVAVGVLVGNGVGVDVGRAVGVLVEVGGTLVGVAEGVHRVTVGSWATRKRTLIQSTFIGTEKAYKLGYKALLGMFWVVLPTCVPSIVQRAFPGHHVIP